MLSDPHPALQTGVEEEKEPLPQALASPSAPGGCSEPPKAEAALSPEAGRSCLYPNSLRPGINSEPYYLPCLSATGASNRIFLKMSE